MVSDNRDGIDTCARILMMDMSEYFPLFRIAYPADLPSGERQESIFLCQILWWQNSIGFGTDKTYPQCFFKSCHCIKRKVLFTLENL